MENFTPDDLILSSGNPPTYLYLKESGWRKLDINTKNLISSFALYDTEARFTVNTKDYSIHWTENNYYDVLSKLIMILGESLPNIFIGAILLNKHMHAIIEVTKSGKAAGYVVTVEN